MFALVQNKEFDKLPGNMPATAREAFDTLLHTRDGQLCDIIIDQRNTGSYAGSREKIR